MTTPENPAARTVGSPLATVVVAIDALSRAAA